MASDEVATGLQQTASSMGRSPSPCARAPMLPRSATSSPPAPPAPHAAASSEQGQGIGQVDTAVNELDRMTQQIAAPVEPSAAAESLKAQAQRPGSVVSAFTLAETAA